MNFHLQRVGTGSDHKLASCKKIRVPACVCVCASVSMVVYIPVLSMNEHIKNYFWKHRYPFKNLTKMLI